MQGYLKNTLSRTKRRFNQSQLGLEPEGKDFREILGERGGGGGYQMNCCARLWANCQECHQERTQGGHDFKMDRKMAVIGGLLTIQGLVPYP
jgi:hypothetical protein